MISSDSHLVTPKHQPDHHLTFHQPGSHPRGFKSQGSQVPIPGLRFGSQRPTENFRFWFVQVFWTAMPSRRAGTVAGAIETSLALYGNYLFIYIYRYVFYIIHILYSLVSKYAYIYIFIYLFFTVSIW